MVHLATRSMQGKRRFWPDHFRSASRPMIRLHLLELLHSFSHPVAGKWWTVEERQPDAAYSRDSSEVVQLELFGEKEI